jgi:AraC-like DNA-binding protein
MRPTIWLNPGILIIYGASLDANKHKHHSIQLIWTASDSICTFSDKEISGSLIINSEVEHQLQMTAGWILLIEPQSDLGNHLTNLLGDQDAVSIEPSLKPSSQAPSPDEEPSQFIAPLFQALGLDFTYANAKTTTTDERIQNLLSRLDGCLPDECLKPPSWRAAEVAESLAISESRFLHLFREQMGITWRHYLLWHRMICAVNAIIKGDSATNAAHLAGFSDSAHLSRTFRSHFGMSIRESQMLFQK